MSPAAGTISAMPETDRQMCTRERRETPLILDMLMLRRADRIVRPNEEAKKRSRCRFRGWNRASNRPAEFPPFAERNIADVRHFPGVSPSQFVRSATGQRPAMLPPPPLPRLSPLPADLEGRDLTETRSYVTYSAVAWQSAARIIAPSARTT